MEPIGDDITGVVLAGGLSSRFGANKALARLHDKPLIQHVAETLAGVFSDCLLVTNTPEDYRFLNLPVTGDRYRGMGPLAGIHAALCHASTQWIFVVGCDMPGVTAELARFISSFREAGYDAVIPWPASGPEPLCGLYNRNILARVERFLADGNARVKELLEGLKIRKITAAELSGAAEGMAVFANVNRPGDLDFFS